jgi:uncharacterized RDD family membrane protein YckC
VSGRTVRRDDAASRQGGRAGLVSRVLASVIDLGLLWLLLLAVDLAVAVVRFFLFGPPLVLRDLPPALVTPISFVAAALYLTYFWSATGRTPGQHLFGLRVIRLRGRRLGAGRSALRAVLCLVFPVGLLWVLVSGKNASIQDLLVRSAVVYDSTHRALESGT